MYTPALRELIKLIVLEEGRSKLKEAEISGDRKVPWGSEEHISDLEGRCADIEYWKNKLPRGSAKRDHYGNVLKHLRNELKSAKKTAERNQLNEKDKV
jgi:hypothetical protein